MGDMNEHPLLCYRGACDNAADVQGYNKVTHGLYCLPCARMIQRNNFADMHLYPLLDHPLLSAEVEGGAWAGGLVLVRPAQVQR